MRVRLHLISPPWAPPWNASPQLGALKAWIDHTFGAEVKSRTYSAALPILYRYRGNLCTTFHDEFHEAGEAIYLLMYWRKYLSAKVPVSAAEIRKFLARLNAARGQAEPVTMKIVEGLEAATTAYVADTVLPHLDAEAVNVIGLTINFNQVHAAVMIARQIRDAAPGKKLLFVFGGFLASLPNIVNLLPRLAVEGYTVFGEGERKLELIIRELLDAESFDGRLQAPPPGVFRIGDPVNLFERKEELFKTELDDLSQLPVPDYEDYYSFYESVAESDPIFARIVPLGLPLEGTRGCFAKCDFCNLNSQWSRFRKQSAADIYLKVQKLAARHPGVRYLVFVDNVCDSFAEKFADDALRSGQRLNFFMELRVHHPLRFWVKLALAGLTCAQVGIEALSPPLLHKMAKGTSVIQNVRVQKYLRELGIKSSAGLITNHPLATRADLEETRRVLRMVSHLDSFVGQRFGLSFGSPLYERLPAAEKRALDSWFFVEPPQALRPFAAAQGYAVPARYLPSVDDWNEWSLLCDEVRRAAARSAAEIPLFTVSRTSSGKRLILDRRFGERAFTLEGLAARVYDACHEGLKIEFLETALGLQRNEFESELQALVRDELILCVDSHYLSLALRPREEVIAAAGLDNHCGQKSPLIAENSLSLG